MWDSIILIGPNGEFECGLEQGTKLGSFVFCFVYTDWERCANATSYINELLSISPTLVDVQSEDEWDGAIAVEQLQVFKMSSGLLTDEVETSSNLVIPPGSADLWEAVCTNAVNETRAVKRPRMAVVGSPGMGKSRSAVFLIRRFIEKRRERGMSPIVVYEHRKELKVWMFVPKDPDSTASPYEAFSVVLSEFSAGKVAALKNRSNLYIVDGDQVGARPMPGLFPAYTVFVVSPDPNQISEFAKHADLAHYFPAWRVVDILAARKYMTTEPFPRETYVTLMRAIGPNPRALFVPAEAALKNANVMLNTMTAGDGSFRVVNSILEGQTTFDNLALNQIKPFSKLMMITRSTEGGFTKCSVEFRSEVARLMVHISHIGTVVNTVLRNRAIDAETKAMRWRTFEMLVFGLAHAGWSADLKVLLGEKAPGCITNIQFQCDETKTMHIEKSMGGEGKTKKKFLAGVYKKLRDFPLCHKDKLEDAKCLCIGSNLPLFDLAAAKNVVLDATVGAAKNLDLKIVQDTMKELDLQDDPDTLLHLVYVLPPGYAKNFKWSKGGWPKVAEDACEEVKKHSEETQEALFSRLRVYTTEVPLADETVWTAVTSVMFGTAHTLVDEVRVALEKEASKLLP